MPEREHEREIQHSIRLCLGAYPERVVLWRNPCGVAIHMRQGEMQKLHFEANRGNRDARAVLEWLKSTGRTVHYGLCDGSSDLIGIANDGRLVALEVKTARGRPTEEQAMFLSLIRRMGGVAEVVRSVEEAKKAVGV